MSKGSRCNKVSGSSKGKETPVAHAPCSAAYIVHRNRHRSRASFILPISSYAGGMECISSIRSRNIPCGRAEKVSQSGSKYKPEQVATYRPCSCHGGHNARADGHGPDASRALEDGAAQCAGNNAVRHVVLPPVVPNGAVDTVVHHGYNTSRIAQERSSSRNGVQHTVES